MTTQSPVDPSDIIFPLENLARRVDKVWSIMCGLHVRNEKKNSYPVYCIWHMLEAGHIPSINVLTDDDNGNIVDEFCENVSIYAANLEDHQQAGKLKLAFVNFPPSLISVGKVYKRFEEYFQMTLFQYDAKQQYNPIQQMNPMQEVLMIS